MSTIATITSSESGSNSLTDINNNFSNLNTDKQEKASGAHSGNLVYFGASNILQDTGLTPPASAIVGINDTQTLTSKTISGASNTLSNIGNAALTNSSVTLGTTSVSLGATSTALAGMTVVNFANNAVTVSSNAGTVPVTSKINTFTNSSAATMAITMATSSAVDGQLSIVRIYDFSGVAQTIGWTNTENSNVSAPTTSNGSTTLPLTVGFQYNAVTSKWRCLASA